MKKLWPQNYRFQPQYTNMKISAARSTLSCKEVTEARCAMLSSLSESLSIYYTCGFPPYFSSNSNSLSPSLPCLYIRPPSALYYTLFCRELYLQPVQVPRRKRGRRPKLWFALELMRDERINPSIKSKKISSVLQSFSSSAHELE